MDSRYDYLPANDGRDVFEIFDKKVSCTVPMATTKTRDAAELICSKLNKRG